MLESHKEYIKYRQRQLEEKIQRAAELEAEKEAARVTKQEEIAARKKLLLEQQEDERLRQKRTQRKEKLAEQKWNKQIDTLLAQVDDCLQKDNKLEEIRIIIQNREPSLQELDWISWLSDPLNQKLADLDFNHAMEMFKRDNLMAKRRKNRRRGRTSRQTNYVLSFTGDSPGNVSTYPLAVGNEEYVTTTFDHHAYNLNNGFTISFWVRPDELGTHMFVLGRRGVNTKERFTFGLQNSTNLYMGVGQNKKISTAHGMSVDTWYHWVITFAGGVSGALIAYRDGEAITLHANDRTTTWDDTDQSWPIFFGGRNAYGNYNNGWACALDEVAIFDEVKDSDWVTSVYNSATNADLSDQSGLVGYWRFNEGSGTTVKDHSGNGNHGTFAAISGDTTAYPTWGKR